MKLHRWVYWVLLTPVILFALEYFLHQIEPSPPYPTLDSGFPAGSNDKLYWLDNDRVIFVSYGPKPKSVEEAQKNPRVPSINIWDTRSNNITKYRDSAADLCYSDGYIVYAVVKRPYDPADPARGFAGQMGQEQEVTPPKGLADFSVVQNPHTCRWVKRPEYTKGRRAIPLREGDGWLVDSKPFSVNELGEWLLYRPDGSVVHTGAPTNLHSVHWAAFAEKYFIGSYTNGTAESDCLKYWWIAPGGTITSGCQDIRPLKRWNRGGLMAAVPSPPGVLVTAGQSGDFDHGTAGLYQTNQGKSMRVNVGETWSPDGCKSAYVDVPGFEGQRVGGQGDARLKMTNVCSKTKGVKS